tara:strand:+ start:2070 stop:2231 length:162 start_codon:yes stop_codon:yes gene_type:complete
MSIIFKKLQINLNAEMEGTEILLTNICVYKKLIRKFWKKWKREEVSESAVRGS